MKQNDFLGNMGPAEFTSGGGVYCAGFYGDGSIALQIRSGGGIEGIATVCLSPEGPAAPAGHVWLKGWSENMGIPEALEKAGIVELTKVYHRTGNVEAQLAKLKNG